jgi:hypothetical protein
LPHWAKQLKAHCLNGQNRMMLKGQSWIWGGGGVNFAFHTNKEQNPWWELTLDKPRPVEYIILHNRKDMCKERARKLLVEVHDGKEYIKIYEGDLLFDAEPNGLPLMLPYKYPQKIERIKITSLINEYFHLSKINVLSYIRDKQLTFIAMRTDGFGERLKAILNAMLLSDIADGKFLFNWEERPDNSRKHHSIVSNKQIFSEHFINKFHIDSIQLNKMQLTELTDAIKIFDHTTLDNAPTYNAITVQGNFSELSKITIYHTKFIKKYKRNFEKIEFSQSLEYAKNCANSIQIKECTVAIHLRAGDIIYGIHRIMDEYTTKVVPFPIVEELLYNLLQQKYDIILFGQDLKLLEYFKNKFGIILSIDLPDPSFSTAQQALFDIVLMSRCKQIFAGNSGFSTVANWIGNNQLINPHNKFNKEEFLKIIELSFESQKFDDRISSFQIAFACWSYFYISGEKYATNEKLWKFLNLAIEYDFENDFYHFVAACSYYNAKKIKDAEEIIYKRFLIVNKQNYSIIQVLNRKRHLGKTLSVFLYLSDLKLYATLGYPMATLCVAIAEKSLGNYNVFLHFKELFLKNRSEKYAIFDKYIT